MASDLQPDDKPRFAGPSAITHEMIERAAAVILGSCLFSGSEADAAWVAEEMLHAAANPERVLARIQLVRVPVEGIRPLFHEEILHTVQPLNRS